MKMKLLAIIRDRRHEFTSAAAHSLFYSADFINNSKLRPCYIFKSFQRRNLTKFQRFRSIFAELLLRVLCLRGKQSAARGILLSSRPSVRPLSVT